MPLYTDIEERAEKISTAHIADVFLSSRFEEQDIQHPIEVYSLLEELEGRSHEERNDLLEYLDSFTSGDSRGSEEFTGDIGKGSLTGPEIADQLIEYLSDREEIYKKYEETVGTEGVEELAMDQLSIFVNDRLRYLPGSRHRPETI